MHTEKRKERLYYWRTAFEPAYQRDLVEAGIEAACAAHGVKGIVAYELLGVCDLLIRAWLPQECDFEDFDAKLADELAPAGLSMCDPFAVDCMVRHWPFVGGDGSPATPEERWISRLEDSEIDEIETKWPDVRHDLLDRLTSQHLLATSEGIQIDRPGIKFAVEVSSDADADTQSLALFEQQLVELLDATTSIAQRSLYAGSGFAHFLIMGRVEYDSFHAIHSDLISQINAAAVRERHNARTLTHISGQRGYRIASELLSGGGTDGGRRAPIGFLQRRFLSGMGDDRILEAGEQFGERFEIVEHLGGGGFANVYAALDKYERVKRALKIFKSLDAEVAFREISALRKVSDPNVVRVYWSDHEGPHWYLVCEFIDGKSLDECPPGEDIWALSIVIQTLRALEAVHPNDQRIAELRERGERQPLSSEDFHELRSLQSDGLIHRDIKPENIMVGEDGHVTIVDFNIASPARQRGKTRSGTPEYLAPDAGYDGWEPADDLFACGVVLYELLVGSHPFLDRNPANGLAPIDPLSVRPDLRPSLAEILLRACASSRSGRYQTAYEMRSVLEVELNALKAVETRIRHIFQRWRTESALSSPDAEGRTGAPSEGERDRDELHEEADALKLAVILRNELTNLYDDSHTDEEFPYRHVPGERGSDRVGEDDRGIVDEQGGAGSGEEYNSGDDEPRDRGDDDDDAATAPVLS